MKTIITLTDTPDGGVDVQYLTQMTTEEVARGMQTEQSPSYRVAVVLNGMLHELKITADMMYGPRAAPSDDQQPTGPEHRKCLH